MNPNFQSIGDQFTKAYYSMFDNERSQLQGLYRGHSMLTFEGNQFQGDAAIIQKLTSLPFQKVQHVLTTVDSQPVENNGVLVFVVGQLKSDDDPPHGFSQTFVLMPETTATGVNYYVMNDIFRLSLHHGLLRKVMDYLSYGNKETALAEHGKVHVFKSINFVFSDKYFKP